MRYGVSYSTNYKDGNVVVRDFKSEPAGRVLCVIVRENRTEAEELALHICDLLNQSEKNELGSIRSLG
jgi:hypothetical protein